MSDDQQLFETLWGGAEAVPHVPLADAPKSPQQAAEQARERARLRQKARTQAGNPMIPLHGRSADDLTCGDCIHLQRGRYRSTIFFKCELFGMTHGPATDFRVNWPACGKFTARGPDDPGVIVQRKAIRVPCQHSGCDAEVLVRSWFANVEGYATHKLPTTVERRGGSTFEVKHEHCIVIKVAPDGTILTLRKAW